jgi:hypothetical protein
VVHPQAVLHDGQLAGLAVLLGVVVHPVVVVLQVVVLLLWVVLVLLLQLVLLLREVLLEALWVSQTVTSGTTEIKGNGQDNVQRPPCNEMG